LSYVGCGKSKFTILSITGYLYGSLATLVISICSMFGAVFIKISNKNIRAYFMASMLSLAVGCLVADAALHLIPEVMTSRRTPAAFK